MTEPVEVVDGEVVSDFLPVPWTGEALPIREMSNADLARALDDAKQFEQVALREFKRAVHQEVLDRMDAAAATGEHGAWTIHAGDWKLEGDSPDRTDYDLDLLRQKLKQLVAEGLLKADVIERVIVPSGWKVAKRPLSQLEKLGGAVREAIESCRLPVTRPRSVRVTPRV